MPLMRPETKDWPHPMSTATISAAIRLLAVWVCLLGATAGAAAQSEWRTWAEAAGRQHPLAGRVYEVAAGKLSDLTDSPRPLLPEGIVLLGEVHDNAAHHQVRAWLLAATMAARPQWRPAVAFEQIDTDRQEAVERFEKLEAGARTAGALFDLLKWQDSGWPPADTYRPLI